MTRQIKNQEHLEKIKENLQSKDVFEFFDNMYQSAMFIQDFLHLINFNYKMFANSRMVQKFFSTFLADMGENLKSVRDCDSINGTHYKEKFDWRNMFNLRDKIFHNYGSVKFDKIWDIVCKDLPVVIECLETIQEKDFPDKQYNHIPLKDFEVFLDRLQKKLEEEQSSSNSIRM